RTANTSRYRAGPCSVRWSGWSTWMVDTIEGPGALSCTPGASTSTTAGLSDGWGADTNRSSEMVMSDGPLNRTHRHHLFLCRPLLLSRALWRGRHFPEAPAKP